MSTQSGPVARGFRRLFEPLAIGDFVVRNRVVVTTHGTGGLSEDRDLRYLQERARGGAGLLGVHSSAGIYGYSVGPGPESASPAWDEASLSPVTPHGIAHYDDVVIPGLARRAEVVHAEGAHCFAQVYHPGAGRHSVGAHPAVAPSAVPDPYEGQIPHPLTEDEIEELVLAYAHGIRRVREAGLDAAEIHGAHGYLVNQFLSPYSNRRTDGWGGSAENRVRFALEMIAAARRMVGDDFPIGIRVGVDGDGEGRGLTVLDLVEICDLLSPHVEYISVSGGNYSGFGAGKELAYVSPWYTEPAFNAAAAAAVKKAVDVPVIVTGRIVDASIAEAILAEGSADLIGMVRALIADPELPNKVRSGSADEVRMCLGLSECHHIGPRRTPVTCAVNAAAGREVEMEIAAAARPKTVVVVGAGPAGLEAARVAALRGHRVFLADARRTIGGTPAVLAHDPNRRNLRDHAAFFEGRLAPLGVELMLGNPVTAEEMIEFAPDAVVVATGSRPAPPDVPGVEAHPVLDALDVLRGADIDDRVLVVGGMDDHLGPPTIAEFLADRGCSVELVSERFDFAGGAEDGTRFAILERLLAKGVDVHVLHRLVRLETRGAVVAHTFSGRERLLEGVTVVSAGPRVPDDRLALELEGRIPEIHLVGDALAPRRIMHATLEGARAGHAL